MNALENTCALWNVLTNAYSPGYLRRVAERVVEGTGDFFGEILGEGGCVLSEHLDVRESYAKLIGSMMVWCDSGLVKAKLTEPGCEYAGASGGADTDMNLRRDAWKACIEIVTTVRGRSGRKGKEGAMLVRALLEGAVK
jgi:hypothetical protein